MFRFSCWLVSVIALLTVSNLVVVGVDLFALLDEFITTLLGPEYVGFGNIVGVSATFILLMLVVGLFNPTSKPRSGSASSTYPESEPVSERQVDQDEEDWAITSDDEARRNSLGP